MIKRTVYPLPPKGGSEPVDDPQFFEELKVPFRGFRGEY
jgi:hypothetical protein